MKNYLLGALLLGSGVVGTTRAMEAEAASTTPTPVSIFSVRDLRYKIMLYLFETKDISGAIKAFKAFCCTDHASYNFFKNSEETTLSFTFDLLKAAHSNGEAIEDVFSALVSNFNLSGAEKFEAKLAVSSMLASMLIPFSRNANLSWNPFLAVLKHGITSSFVPTVMHYHWKDGSDDRKTLLTKALQFGAPTNVIETLIQLGSQVKDLPQNSSPCCLIVMKNYLSCRKQLTQAQNNEVKAKEETNLKSLEAIMDLLLEKGAGISDSFCTNQLSNAKLTPLSGAIAAHDLTAIDYLIKKGALSFDPYALLALYDLEGSWIDPELSRSIHEALFTIPSYPEYFLYNLLSRVLPRRLPATGLGNPYAEKEILDFLSSFLDTIEDLNVPVPYEEDLTFLDIARICNNNEQVITLLIERGATTKETNKERLECMMRLALQKSSKKVFSESLAKSVIQETESAIEKWGFHGVPLPLIEQTLALVCCYPTLLELAEFFKSIHTKQFRPFFSSGNWIISIPQYIWIDFELSDHDRRLLKLINWLYRETSLNVSVSTKETAKSTDENWNELVQQALALKPTQDKEHDAIFITAKKLMLNTEATSTSLFSVLCLLPILYKDLSSIGEEASTLSLAANDFLKWAKIRGYLPDVYSQEVATPILKNIISLCCINPDGSSQSKESPLFKLISWFAQHIQDREIFAEWKAVAEFAQEQNLLELADHIEQVAHRRLEEL